MYDSPLKENHLDPLLETMEFDDLVDYGVMLIANDQAVVTDNEELRGAIVFKSSDDVNSYKNIYYRNSRSKLNIKSTTRLAMRVHGQYINASIKDPYGKMKDADRKAMEDAARIEGNIKNAYKYGIVSLIEEVEKNYRLNLEDKSGTEAVLITMALKLFADGRRFKVTVPYKYDPDKIFVKIKRWINKYYETRIAIIKGDIKVDLPSRTIYSCSDFVKRCAKKNPPPLPIPY